MSQENLSRTVEQLTARLVAVEQALSEKTRCHEALQAKVDRLEEAISRSPPCFLGAQNLSGFDFAAKRAAPPSVCSSESGGGGEIGNNRIEWRVKMEPRVTLTGMMLEGRDLLAYCDLQGAKFVRSKIGKGADLQWADMRNCDFRASRVKGTLMEGAALSGSVFVMCRMSHVVLSGAGSHVELDKANFESARLESVVFKEISFIACSFKRSQLVDCQFVNCTFKKDCTFSETSFEGSLRMTGCHFEQALFETVKFSSSDAKDSSIYLAGCDIEGSTFSDCSLVGVSLQNAKLSGSTFRHNSLVSSDFRGADASRAQFTTNTFSSVDFGGANLSCSEFNDATFNQCSIGGAQLYGTEFTAVKVDGEGSFIHFSHKTTSNRTTIQLESLALINSVSCQFRGSLCTLSVKVGDNLWQYLTTGFGFASSYEYCLKYTNTCIAKEFLFECSSQGSVSLPSIEIFGTPLAGSAFSEPPVDLSYSNKWKLKSSPVPLPPSTGSGGSPREIQLSGMVSLAHRIMTFIVPFVMENAAQEERQQTLCTLINAIPLLRFALGKQALLKFGFRAVLQGISCEQEFSPLNSWHSIDDLLQTVAALECPTGFEMVWNKYLQETAFFSNLQTTTLLTSLKVASVDTVRQYASQFSEHFSRDNTFYYKALEQASRNPSCPLKIMRILRDYNAHRTSESWLLECCHNRNELLLDILLLDYTPSLNQTQLLYAACSCGSQAICKKIVKYLSVMEASLFWDVKSLRFDVSEDSLTTGGSVYNYHPPLGGACNDFPTLKWLLSRFQFQRIAILYTLGMCCQKKNKRAAAWIMEGKRNIYVEGMAGLFCAKYTATQSRFVPFLEAIKYTHTKPNAVTAALCVWGAAGGGSTQSYPKGGNGGYVGGIISGHSELFITVGGGGTGGSPYASRIGTLSNTSAEDVITMPAASPFGGTCGKGGEGGLTMQGVGKKDTCGNPGFRGGGGDGAYVFHSKGPLGAGGGGGASIVSTICNTTPSTPSGTPTILGCGGGGGGCGALHICGKQACGGGGGGCSPSGELGSGGAGCHGQNSKHQNCSGANGNGDGGCCRKPTALTTKPGQGDSGLPIITTWGHRGVRPVQWVCAWDCGVAQVGDWGRPTPEFVAIHTARTGGREASNVTFLGQPGLVSLNYANEVISSGEDGCVIVLSLLTGYPYVILQKPGSYKVDIGPKYAQEVAQLEKLLHSSSS
ncbi:hypothetical protein Pelo_16523 [Pelomyxa schiedti]|nr:hypothetical protein Pelo_16523 [Pelomyxa schiedti]